MDEKIREEDKQIYLQGMYRGVKMLRTLFTKLSNEERGDLIEKMLSDMELTSLLLKKHELCDEDEYEYLSAMADEEWEEEHSIESRVLPPLGLDFSALAASISGAIDPERERKIKLMEILSEECEDELYNNVAMGLDDELYEKLFKKYGL